MNAFLLLFFAILSEIVGTTALKLSDGFTRLGPSIVVAVGYGLAFYLLALCLRHIPVGTVYAIWSGLGTMGVALVGVFLFRESLDVPRVAGIILIVAGVAVLNVFSKTPA